MSAPVYTAEEVTLARELHAIGVEGVRTEKTRLGMSSGNSPVFSDLDPWQQAGWLAIARHVIAAKKSERKTAP